MQHVFLKTKSVQSIERLLSWHVLNGQLFSFGDSQKLAIFFLKNVVCFVALVGKSAAHYHSAICECNLRLFDVPFFEGRNLFINRN